MKTIDRLKVFLDETRVSYNSFDVTIGAGNGYIGKQIKRKASIGSDMIETIVSKYPQLNVVWLLTGKGDMLLNKKKARPSGGVPAVVTVDEGGNDNIVLVDVKAAAGYPIRHLEPSFIKPLPAFKLPGAQFRNSQFRAFEVEGDSMSETLEHGSWVIASLLDDYKSIKDGYIHVVVTESEVSVKRLLNRVDDRGAIVLQSDNHQYPPRQINYEEVKELWLVKANIGFNLRNRSLDIKKQLDSLIGDMLDVKDRLNRLERK